MTPGKPSFLGYCCFQAALVFLNSLERCKDESQRGEFTDKFKVIFIILGALRRFYQPANLWVSSYPFQIAPVFAKLVF